VPERNLRRLAAAIVVLAVVVVAALLVRAWLATRYLPDGPLPVAFDHAACAHCRMLISEAAFAAQLQAKDGRVYDFDDPGCLLRFEAEQLPDVYALWFHHVREERWLPGGEVGFVEITPTPMGYGLGAVEADTPGALTLDAARRRVEATGSRSESAGSAAPAAATPAEPATPVPPDPAPR
jgi:hypothetical protein